MAEETVITLCPYQLYDTTVDDVIRLLRDLTPTEKIHLVLRFINRDGFRFNDTVELRELVVEKKSQIQRLEVYSCFEFLVQFLLANNGTTTHFRFTNRLNETIPMQFEHATELSHAIRSNNNNGNIESFIFSLNCDSSKVFQPVWDALLATTVQDVNLSLEFPENNNKGKSASSNNLDFSNISTNTSLKKLFVDITLYGTNLFDSIKGNTTLETVYIISRHGDVDLPLREQRAFLAMLLENTTLIHVELLEDNFNRILQEEINIHTTLNQIWKRLLIIKRKERIAAAAAAAISTTAPNAAITAVDDTVEKNKKIAEEKKTIKKKKEMNLWLQTFEKKPVIRNELIYLFLTENAGDKYNTNNNGTSTILDEVERKRKRHNNNGTI